MKIMLDAGHFGKQNRSPILPEYYESVMTWELSHRLQAALEQYGITVGQTRSQQEVDMPVYQRGKSSAGYDLFISVHSNAFSDANIDRPPFSSIWTAPPPSLAKSWGHRYGR